MAAFFSICIIALSLALDAFSVSVAGGIKARQASWRDALKVGLFFGGFQAGMPVIGWAIGTALQGVVASVSGWVAFALLSLVGLNMIWGALKADDHANEEKHMLRTRTLLMLAIATSIDALVVGVTLNLIDLPLYISVLVIGVITFVLSVAGFLGGKKLGSFFSGKIEILGGLALIAIGLKLLLVG